MDVATIIVNYRTADATVDAVTTLLHDFEKLVDPWVVVVDNDSGDGSFERLRKTFDDAKWENRVVVIDSKHNGGFGHGVNVGVRYVLDSARSPRYFYVLNPDATVDPGALGELLSFMESHPDAGLLGNVVRNEGADVIKAFRFPSMLSELEGGARLGVLTLLLRRYVVPIDPADSCEVDWVSGVSMLFRREVFSTVGFFDEGFFLYFEEIDFARRLRQAGWKVYFVANVGVGHIGGLSTGFNDQTRRIPRYWFQSRRRYFVKHHGRLYAAACDAAWVCGHAIFMTKVNLLRRKQGTRPSMGLDFLRYSLANLLKPAPEAEQNLPPSRAPRRA
jgi:N-acetylglucosaminyl-diphospho-decaprenol L-rhamnosyltransferase